MIIHVSAVISDTDEEKGDSLSTGGIVAITLVLTLLVSLPMGVMIGCCGMWCIIKPHKYNPHEEKGQQLQEETNVDLYEVPDFLVETNIPLSQNEAYGLTQRRN